MKFTFYLFLFILISVYELNAQNINIVTGVVVDNYTNEYLLNVEVSIVNSMNFLQSQLDEMGRKEKEKGFERGFSYAKEEFSEKVLKVLGLFDEQD